MNTMKFIFFGMLVFLVAGCSTSSLVVTEESMPVVYEDDGDKEIKNNITISLFRLNNYTDTPRAGKRAGNIIEGILYAKGYRVKSHLKEKVDTLKKAKKAAKEDGSKYFMFGGVSEWRYKTGIDGEPAVSLQLGLYKTKNAKLVWSATASDSDWGNASIGTTAQDLVEEMMAE